MVHFHSGRMAGYVVDSVCRTWKKPASSQIVLTVPLWPPALGTRTSAELYGRDLQASLQQHAGVRL